MLKAVQVVGVRARELAAARAQFPTVELTPVSGPPEELPHLEGRELFAADAWRRDLWLGEQVARLGALAISPEPYALTAMLTRYQRWIDRRNAASSTAAFDELLARHLALHDLDKPLVRADFDHARDVWQWLLRLSPSASIGAQAAALFHDVERLSSEADRRIEQHAPDYDAFKAAHARAGVDPLRRSLADLLEPPMLERAAELIAAHEGAPPEAVDSERQLLADADALSFFSLNSPGFADYYGPEHTRKKVIWTLARLSPRGRAHLDQVALRDDVAALYRQVESR
ncbi:MAG TPA: DUF4202 family protein [Polyangia bacterium]